MNAPNVPLPDVAGATAATVGRLHRVGMRGIAAPVLVALEDGPRTCRASIDLTVSLDDPAKRGIHMSRLYLLLEGLTREPLSPAVLRSLLEAMVASQQGLSHAASVQIRFEVLLRRKALVSGLAGWKSYPCRIDAHLEAGRFQFGQTLELVYSSTCPMSAALSRAANREAFLQAFGEAAHVPVAAVAEWLESEPGMAATPHAQRSTATLVLAWDPAHPDLPVEAIVDRVESVLATPVQTAVKRADEQAFARLNATNLMFCEDAARRTAQCLVAMPGLADFSVTVAHLESLHAHDAIAIARRADVLPDA